MCVCERERVGKAGERQLSGKESEKAASRANIGRDDIGVLVAEVAENTEALFVERVGGAQ